MAAKEGTFTIGPAAVMVNGRRYTTSAVKIKVVKGRAVPQNNQAQQRGYPGDEQDAGPPPSGDLSKSVFIKAVVDKTRVYQGEQIILNYRLYTRLDIGGNGVDKLPDLNGFWSEEIRSGQPTVQLRVEMYKGVKYGVADIKQTILFPEHAGDLVIDPLGMTFMVRQPVASQDPIEQFFGGSVREVKYKTKSAPVIIHVMPLPEAGKPADFTGAVGNFSINAGIDKREVKANEALNYNVKITGSGNIKLFKALNTNFPPDFEKYDPKVSDTVTETTNGVSGSRIYDYLLIPRHEGAYTIDPLKFSYFNPATGRYVSLNTKAFQVKVDKGTAQNNVTAFSADKQDVKMLGKDIRYIKTGDAGLSKEGDGFYGSVGYYVLLLLGPLACCGAFVYRNRMREQNRDVVKVKSRNAGKVAAKHLASAQKQLQAKNTKAFYEDIFKGLYGYLSDKLNIAYADLDRDVIASAVKARSVSDVTAAKLLDTLDLCEMARYAPVTHISQQEVFDKAKGIINDIENEI